MTKTIGWIGLGNMGTPMSTQLAVAGFPLVVYNRNPAKTKSLESQGAQTAMSPAELLRQADIVFVMVSDDNAIREIFTGPGGLMEAAATGKIIVNMSTVSPVISKQMAELCDEQGNQYLDAPVSGSVRQAEEGKLVIMVGGAKQAFEEVKPLFEKLGSLAVRVGDTGAGNAAKLAINTLLAIQAQGIAEVVLFAGNQGIDTGQLLSMINSSALGNPFMKIKGAAILNDQYEAAFALKHIAKDLRLAKDLGLNTALGQVAYHTFQQAEPAYGNEDIIAILKYLQKS